MRNKFRITVLSDNRKLDETLESEHGLCIFLDTGEFKVLLDTGASGQFIQNAERLGIDIKEIDYVFVSHGHADHIGGLIPKIVQIGKVLRDNYPETRFFTGHCTGTLIFELLKNQLNQQIELFYTGFATQL